MKQFILFATALAATAALSACGGSDITGRWMQPVPGMDGQMQGVELMEGGKAASINMETLKYETWQRDGNRLILTGKSIGNGTTADFADTLTIVSVTATDLTLRQGDQTMNYSKQ